MAPAGQSKLRSGGLREGSLTHVCGCAPCCRPRTRQWMRRFAMSLAQVVLAFRCGGSRVAYACRLPLRRPLTQSKTPRRPRVRACCWFALLFLVPPMVAFACWCRTSRCRRQLWRTRLQSKTANRCVRQIRWQKHGESTPAPCRIWLRQNDSEMWP